ncbi:membrane protein [Achromatium sp. WMS2]|nr:membrane protein [Achromatium sp. WMS2]
MNGNTPLVSANESLLATNKVIRNTYILLSLTLLFSAFMAWVSMAIQLPVWIHFASSIVALLLLWFVLPSTEDSAAGIVVVFGVTGLLGLGLGPIISMYMNLPKGPEIVATAMGGTGAIFIGLSAYALTTRKDFSFMTGFLMVGLLVVLIAILANIFLALPILSLTISAVVILLMSGFILYDTSNMIHGGETNYVRATINLYINIYNLFLHLLRFLGMLSSDE